ncbi:YfbM family protein [Oceanivirga salmonicida]|uniref:YfbM family protein n=1 Tax=Oceanivirga salmonicida TaxID=1769291 RepID=UPI0018D26B46|nr:YfbM family protein [Oceanivirga salmonicida]
MSCRAVLFSLNEEEVNKIKLCKNDIERLNYLQEDIEETYFEKFPTRVSELDKSWDGLHRSLTDGRYAYNNGEYPLNHVILGGESLYQQDDYIMILKTPAQVKDIAKAIEEISKLELRKGYDKIPLDDEDYSEFLSEEDFQYTWEWFEYSKKFWRLAAKENRYVLFTVDQ